MGLIGIVFFTGLGFMLGVASTLYVLHVLEIHYNSNSDNTNSTEVIGTIHNPVTGNNYPVLKRTNISKAKIKGLYDTKVSE